MGKPKVSVRGRPKGTTRPTKLLTRTQKKHFRLTLEEEALIDAKWQRLDVPFCDWIRGVALRAAKR